MSTARSRCWASTERRATVAEPHRGAPVRSVHGAAPGTRAAAVVVELAVLHVAREETPERTAAF